MTTYMVYTWELVRYTDDLWNLPPCPAAVKGPVLYPNFPGSRLCMEIWTIELTSVEDFFAFCASYIHGITVRGTLGSMLNKTAWTLPDSLKDCIVLEIPLEAILTEEYKREQEEFEARLIRSAIQTNRLDG